MTAILLKEFRSYLRGARPFTMLTIYIGLISGLFLMIYSGTADSPFTTRSQLGIQLFSFTIGLALLQLVFLSPALHASALGGERDRQTIDLLMVTPLKRIMIIIGKLTAPSIFLILLSIAVLPLAGLAFMIGGIELRDFLFAFVTLVGTAVGYGSIGIWAAARTRTNRGGTLLSQVICFLLAIGIPLAGLLFASLFFRGSDGLIESMMKIAVIRYPLFILLSLSPFVCLFAWVASVEGGSATFWTIDLPTELGGGKIPQFWVMGLLTWLVLIPLLLWWSARRLPKTIESGG